MVTLTIYLLSISLLLIAAVVILRIFVRRDYHRRGHLSVISSALQALLFFVYGGFPYIYLPGEWPVSHVNLVLRVIGLTFITFGLAIILFGVFRLGILRSFGRQTGVLKETGFYRVTRNPQVLGCVLYVIGFVMLWPSWYALGWGLLFVPIIHMMVLTEEEHLLNTYGQDYQQYCNRVPRYLGFPKEGNGSDSDQSG
jgi:protein-S-isoprenylcysteine O-methyltransferase Ste14